MFTNRQQIEHVKCTVYVEKLLRIYSKVNLNLKIPGLGVPPPSLPYNFINYTSTYNYL